MNEFNKIRFHALTYKPFFTEIVNSSVKQVLSLTDVKGNRDIFNHQDDFIYTFYDQLISFKNTVEISAF